MPEPRPLKVVFCWSEVAGYMPACWRALADRPGVELHVLHLERLYDAIENPFDLAALMDGLSHQMFRGDRADRDRFLLDAVVAECPDVVVQCGWIYWPYTRLMSAPALAGVPMVLGMDSPWLGTPAQRLNRWRLRVASRRIHTVVTAGERSAEYARRLGFTPSTIVGGYYGYDDGQVSAVASRRDSTAWPRQFLFVGRYVPPKDLATLVKAYQRYRALVRNPWGLTCCGVGPDQPLLAGIEGIVDRGFQQPAAVPEVFATHGAFVMPSRFEPWGVVIAEAAASGLPVVCTSACGASVDLVRDYYSGVIVPPEDPERLARALVWMHEHADLLPVMGQRGRQLATAFSAEAWAARWHHYLLEAASPQ